MKRFILIDDEPIFNFLTKNIIEKSGIADKIESFNSAPKALESIREMENNCEDCQLFILLDIRMPLMSGFEFIEELMKLKNKVIKHIDIVDTIRRAPIIMISTGVLSTFYSY